jgi:carbon storage regulator CsrA
MLVLSRKAGETIVLRMGEVVVEVAVTRCHDQKVRLSFEAPPEVKIWRKELEMNAEYSQLVPKEK